MKTRIALSIVGLLSIYAQAADYPMSGQDTVYQAGSVPSIALVNKDGRSLGLENGHAYRLRFSNASSSFNIMAGDGKTNEFKVNGGFPGGDLRNFELDGARFGNPSVKLSKFQGTQTLRVSEPYRTTETCSYECGQDYVCRDVPEQVCRNRTERVCRDHPDRVCHTDVRGNRICEQVMRRECHNQEVRDCDTVYHRVCGYETRYCSGVETWMVRDTTNGEVLEMKVLDANNGSELGRFRGVLNSNTSRERVELIDSTCRR